MQLLFSYINNVCDTKLLIVLIYVTQNIKYGRDLVSIVRNTDGARSSINEIYFRRRSRRPSLTRKKEDECPQPTGSRLDPIAPTITSLVICFLQ